MFSRPLCGFVDVLGVHDPSAACPPYIPQFVLTWRTLGLALAVGIGVLLFLLVLGGRWALPRVAEGRPARWWVVVGVALLAVAAVPLLAIQAMADTPFLALENIPVEPIALLVAIPLGYLAVQVLAARDARRFVGGVVIAIVVTFIVFYPEHLGAAPAVVDGQRVPGPAADVPLRLPVPGEHGQPERRDQLRHAGDGRARPRPARDVRRGRLLGLDLAARARGAPNVRGRPADEGKEARAGSPG